MGVQQRYQELTLSKLPDLAGAIVMSSWLLAPAVPVHQIASVVLPAAHSFVSLIQRACQAEPFEMP